MIDDKPLIELEDFITIKTENTEENILETSYLNHVFNFNDPFGTSRELIDDKGAINKDSYDRIILPSIKQDINCDETATSLNSGYGKRSATYDHTYTHLYTDLGTSNDIDSENIDDTCLEDIKPVIDGSQSRLGDIPSIEYECGECSLALRTRSALRNHIKKHHVKLQEKFKRYNCTSCSYSSRRRDKLDSHVKEHVLHDGVHPSGKKRLKPQSFPQRHKHKDEEYRCLECPYTCTVYKAMKKHEKRHVIGHGPFTLKLSCKICGKDRPTSKMQKHMEKHQRDQRFLCDLCSFSSVQLKKVILHRRMHTGEKPHLCPYCEYRSARRDNLRSHVRRTHKKENIYIDTFNPDK